MKLTTAIHQEARLWIFATDKSSDDPGGEDTIEGFRKEWPVEYGS